MGAAVLPCFRAQSQSTLLTEDASAFCSFLVEDLKRLEQLLAEGSVSFKWSVGAMNLLKRMHVELLALIKRSELPISYGAEEDWFDQYMKATATLLDFCNSLKAAVSGINRYRMVIDLAVEKLSEDSSSSRTDINEIEFKRLERAREKLLDFVVVKERLRLSGGLLSKGNGKHEKSIAAVMLLAKTTMITVSLLLVSAMVSPVSIDMGRWELSYKVPQLTPCIKSLSDLVGRFHEIISRKKHNSGLALVEYSVVEEVVEELKAQAVGGFVEDRERFLGGVELLRTRSAELREGVEMFDAVVNEAFDVVIKGRNEMLSFFRDGAPAAV